MPTHNISMTCIANEDIDLYAAVKIVREENPTDGLPAVEMTDTATDIVFGICMNAARAGELVTVRNPFSGILPAYAYINVEPGDRLTLGLSRPGSFSNNTDAQYSRSIAYVMQIGDSSDTEETRCAIIFTRAYYV